MTFAYACILISLFIPISCAAYAKFSVKGYDNKSPRDFLAGLDGAGKRANYAQNNFYETFPAFAVGVVAAYQMGADPAHIDLLAMTYVIARVLYAIFYIKDKDILRSLAWAAAFIAIICLYLSGVK